MTGLEGVLGAWNCGISMDLAGLADKSSTDLVNGRMWNSMDSAGLADKSSKDLVNGRMS